MAEATYSIPDSEYSTSDFLLATHQMPALIFITLDEPRQLSKSDFRLKKIVKVLALENAYLERPVLDHEWRLQQVSLTSYTLLYTGTTEEGKFSTRSLFIEIAGIPSTARFSLAPAPQPVSYQVTDILLFNSESTTVVLRKNLRRFVLNASTVRISAGELRNFTGSGFAFKVDVVAPATGFGVIELTLDGYSEVFEEILYGPRPTEDILFLERENPHLQMVREDGVLFLENIEDELDTLNDFWVLILFDQNVTGFTVGDVIVEAIDSGNDNVAAFVVDFEGENAVYAAKIRVLSPGGKGVIVVSVGANATDQGNPIKSLTLMYDDALVMPEWEQLFVTDETYNDIVSVTDDGVQLLRESNIDFFDFEGTKQADQQVVLPEAITVTRAVKSDVGKYAGLAASNDSRVHFFREGSVEWQSDAVWTLATDRSMAGDSEIMGLAVSDWVWTQDREIIVASMPFMNHAAAFGKLAIGEFYQAIRDGYDLNDVVFEQLSLNYEDLLTREEWQLPVAIAYADGLLYVGSNEVTIFTRPPRTAQNYIFIFDEDGRLVPSMQMPIEGRVKSLFVHDRYLYRYNDTAKSVSRFALDALRLPTAKKTIYPQAVRAGDRVDLKRLFRWADTIVFDVGFEKPRWLSIEANELVVADDAPVDGTAYVRLRGINPNGATPAGSCGFYVYVEALVAPKWLDFEKLSMYTDQAVNLHWYVRNADAIEWQDGFSVPDGWVLKDGVLRREPQ